MDLSDYRRQFEDVYQQFAEESYNENHPLDRACRYALQGEGKRVRPLLVLLACKVCGQTIEQGMLPAIAVELIHTYSLVHDDLPSIDNDDYRRGRLTVHKVFDDATALLAGDALLSDSWAVLTGARRGKWFRSGFEISLRQAVSMVQTLANAVGSRGMVLGQMMDIHWTGRQGYGFEDLNFIHRRKTGALIGASCVLGGMAANARQDKLKKLESFGQNLGLAFQVIDDLLDDLEGTGKTKGKDINQGKVTYLSTMARPQAETLAEKYTDEASSQLLEFGSDVAPLKALAELLLHRKK